MKVLLLFVLFSVVYLTSSSNSYHDNLITVYEHVWVDDNVVESHKIGVEVPVGAKLYDVMVEAAARDDDFKFEAIYYNGLGYFITKIGGHLQVPANNKYWLIFITDKAPKKNNPPGQADLSPLGVSSLVVEEKKHYLFWLRTANFTHT